MKAVARFSRHRGLDDFAANHPDIDFVEVEDNQGLAQALPGAEALFVSNRIYDADMAQIVREVGTDLRWIQFFTAGFDNGLKNGFPVGVQVTNAAGISAPMVATQAIALMLALARRYPMINQRRAEEDWARDEIAPTVVSLEDATLVIIGLGSVGREVARKAKPLDVRIIAVTREGEAGGDIDEVMGREKLHDALGRADMVVMATDATAETHHMLSTAEFAAMKPTAFVINIARGELIDEAALIKAVEEDRIAGAGLDVTEAEPLPKGSPLWGLKNTILTFHTAGGGGAGAGGGAKRLFALIDGNITRFKAGEPFARVVHCED